MTVAWTLVFILVSGFHQSTSVARECTERGKFPNDQKDSCAGYTMCLAAGVNHFAQYNLTCPEGFIFNHELSQCTNVTSYQCQPLFNCTQAGYFPDPNNENCTSYIACVEGFNDFITARSIACPENHTFNPDISSCVFGTNFECHPKEQDSYVEEIPVRVAESTVNSGFSNSISYCVFIYSIFISFSLKSIQ